jgi:hypothetical protein
LFPNTWTQNIRNKMANITGSSAVHETLRIHVERSSE